ncbi:hypothetical protein AVEN_228793-1 [Araneus ventricosus]|uniref:Uncharacterized protein n=1 Tax=Araneus ventricosus TaxID=182803 RepID=A0A4Y2KVY5_ARAVE|nr:hypothetical protein AVEN_228793-1 [Araneus ventricosus]
MSCKDIWTLYEAISEPHLPSKEANRLRLAFVDVKVKFLTALDRLARCERVIACICLLPISENVASRNVDKKRTCYFSDKNDPDGLFPVGIPETAGECDLSTNPTGLQQCITGACASVSSDVVKGVQGEIQARVHMCIVAHGQQFEHGK